MESALVLTSVLFNVALPPQVGELCVQNLKNYHNKNFAPDPNDCHYYYQCFYLNDTYVDAYRQKCAQGLFWHDQVFSCMPEGKTPCQDRCLDKATQTKGCYSGTGCRQFFKCSNTASYGMCCPDGTRFSEAKCECEQEASCRDPCIQVGPPAPNSTPPPEKISETVCKDSYGTSISSVEGSPNAYIPLDQDGHHTVKMLCPQSTSFNLATCQCEAESDATFASPIQPNRQAIFFASFDQDTMDQSMNKFATFLNDGAERAGTTFAQGTGSLRTNGGYMSIPGLTSIDLRGTASFCAFFKCQDGSCSTKGGILSNYKNENEFTLAMGIDSSKSFIGRLHFREQVASVTVKFQIQVPTKGWNHACLTYDGKAVRLYLNGALADTKSAEGYLLSITHVPYLIGRDQKLGLFKGYIDEVMVAPFALTQDEIEAHRNGKFQIRKPNVKPTTPFGGLYSIGQDYVGAIKNNFTNDANCPYGTKSYPVGKFASAYSDAPSEVYLCWDPDMATTPYGGFGGMYYKCDGTSDYDRSNFFTGSLSCPKGYNGRFELRMKSPVDARNGRQVGCTQSICYDPKEANPIINDFYQMVFNKKGAVPNPINQGSKSTCGNGYGSVWYASSKAPQDVNEIASEFYCLRNDLIRMWYQQ